MTDKKKTNLFGKLFGRLKKRNIDEDHHEDDLIDDLELKDDNTTPGIRFEDIEEDEDEIFVAQEFSLSNEQKQELEAEDRTGEHDIESMLSESEEDSIELPPAPVHQQESPPENFPIEPPVLEREGGADEVPSIPIEEEAPPTFDELPPTVMQESKKPQKPNITENRPIDLDAIKNYEFTDEDDEEDQDASLSNYKMFDPNKHAKGIRAFLNKSKEALGNIKLDNLKAKFKNFNFKSAGNIKNFKTPKFLKTSIGIS